MQYSRHSTRFSTLHFPKELQLNAERSVENDPDDPIDSLHESSFNLSVKCPLESTPASTCSFHTARSYVLESLVFVLDTQIYSLILFRSLGGNTGYVTDYGSISVLYKATSKRTLCFFFVFLLRHM